MSNLFASLSASAGALRTFERALEVTQNNVNNASTPGYAKQRLALEALPFQPLNGLPGGVKAGELQSARDYYADAEVRQKLQAFGYADQKTISLSAIEASIDVSGEGDIPGALNTLFQSFSAWSVDPQNLSMRQAVIDSAQQVSMAFQRTSGELNQTANNLNLEIGRTVDNINDLASRIRAYNEQQLRSGGSDPGIEAQVTAALEEMSDLADISVLRQEDGTVTVLLGNQTPLVIGRNQYEVSTEVYSPSDPAPVYNGAPPNIRIVDSTGKDITKQVSGGRAGALLETRNGTIASLLGDSYQMGDLNQLAKAVADTVNGLFASGVTPDGQPGAPLFTYSGTSDTAAAQSLSVSSTITPEQLAAIEPGPPLSSNGIAVKLAKLSSTPSAQTDGLSLTEFFGALAEGIGRDLGAARDSQQTQENLLVQARGMRDQISAVNLDEEAIHLLEFQRSYEAAAKMITVLDELTRTTLSLLQ